jgi:hypothetical protein
MISDSFEARAANKALVRRFINEFKNGCKLDAIDELFSSNFLMHGAETRGRDELKAFRLSLAKAHPNVRGQVDDLLADENKVVERSSWRAQSGAESNKKGAK